MATSKRYPGQADLKVGMSREERESLKARAHAVGMTVTAWARQLLGLPKAVERRGRKKTGRKPRSERKRNDTKERGVGTGNYTRKPRAPRMVQAPLFPDAEAPPPASSPSSAPVKGAASSAPATSAA